MLKTRFRGQKYIWLLGLIWAIWHYPFTIYITLSNMQEVTTAEGVITIIVSLVGQTMSLIGMTFLYVWVYSNTKSVFVVIILHALTNVIPLYILSFFEIPQGFSMILGFIPWVLVIFLRIILGRERFPDPCTAV
jgi:membrane protease YdiL (CAAX protease family)